MSLLLIFGLLVVFAVALAVRELLSKRRGPSVPSSLPVKGKQFFFTRSERAFYALLLQALPEHKYRVFPNVRLNDLFFITAKGEERHGVYARLRDKHVDFLVVSLPDFRPVVGIELDGSSHDRAEQKYRDAVKDVVFRSGGISLLRFRTEEKLTSSKLALALVPHLK